MLIYRHRHHDKVVGSIDEFCPIHGTIHQFDLVERRNRPSVKGTPVAKGTHVCHYIQDPTGRCVFSGQIQPEVVETADAQQHRLHQLRLERQLLQDPNQVPLDVREAMAYEAFVAIGRAHAFGPAPTVVTRHTKRLAWIWMLASVVAFAAAMATQSDALLRGFLLVLFGGGVVAVRAQSRVQRRFRNRAAETAEVVLSKFGLGLAAERQILSRASQSGYRLADDMLSRRQAAKAQLPESREAFGQLNKG